MESSRQSGSNSLSVRENLDETRLPVTSRIQVIMGSQEDNAKLKNVEYLKSEISFYFVSLWVDEGLSWRQKNREK